MTKETNSIFRLNYEKEIQLFNHRNQKLLQLFPKLSQAIDEIFKQISPEGKFEIIIYMLGRICIRHFESIVLLCLNGFGFRAMAILRSLFEKSIDSYYLNQNPNKLDDFIHYSLIQLKKTGFESLAQKKEPNFTQVIKKFRHPKTKQTRISWSEVDFITRAKSVGADEFIINYAYRIPNEFVHSSCSELEHCVSANPDGTLTPIESDNNDERKLADLAFSLACRIVIQVMDNQIACFNLQKNKNLEEYADEINKIYDSLIKE